MEQFFPYQECNKLDGITRGDNEHTLQQINGYFNPDISFTAIKEVVHLLEASQPCTQGPPTVYFAYQGVTFN